MKKAYFNWSSGKDSALALYKVLQEKEFAVSRFITTVNKDFKRISMHGLREELLDKQVKSIGIPLQKIYFPADLNMEDYNATMKKELTILKSKGYDYTIFGDIFLEDLKQYRDTKLAEVAIEGVYPLWKRNTKEVLQEFLSLGFKAITVCVNAKLLGKEFVGREIDDQFIKDLPEGIDVCGENGEFHTFVYDGPFFKTPIDFKIGEKVLKSYTLHDKEDDNCYQPKKKQKIYDTSFWYCDLIPE